MDHAARRPHPALGWSSRVTDALRIVPANEASWDDIQAVFGRRGSAAVCQCQRYKLQPGEAFRSFPASERAERLREQTNAGNPDAASTSGLVAYLGDEPVGWCALEPRPAYFGLLRVFRTPWEGRDEDKEDAGIWSVTCVFVRAGYRKRGLAYELARAAVDFARARGAHALEAYPMRTGSGVITWDEIHVGAESIFADAGMVEVSRPGKRRVVMRIEFDPINAGH